MKKMYWLLIMICAVFFQMALAQEESGKVTVKILVKKLNESKLIIKDKKKCIILDRVDNSVSKTSVILEARPKYDPKNGWYEFKIDERIYKWTSDGNVNILGKNKKSAIIETTEDTWGNFFKIKLKYKTSEIKYTKPHGISAEDEISMMAPKIILNSATFSETGGGNGFKILEEFRGAPVSTPEVIVNKEGESRNVSPFGFISGEKVCFIPEFSVLPEEINSIVVRYDGDSVLTTEKTRIDVNNGKARGLVEGLNMIPHKYMTGPESSDKCTWRFELNGKALSLGVRMAIDKYYILRYRNNEDPWKNLLKAAFEKWHIGGVDSNANLVARLSQNISASTSYNRDDYDPENGKFGSLYVNQQISPMPLSVSRLVDDICNNSAKVICVEAAGLLEYTVNVLGEGGVVSRGITWTGWPSNLHAGRSWMTGHAYCIFNGKVYDPTPPYGRSTGMSEDDYIREHLHNDKRSDFTDPENKNFHFE